MRVNSILGVNSARSSHPAIFNKDASTILVGVCFIKNMLTKFEGILMFGRSSVNLDYISQQVRLHNGSIRKMK